MSDKKHRAVVSVAFNREQFEIVDKAAERAGVKLSQFIRDAVKMAMQPKRAPVNTSQTYNSCMITYLEMWQVIP